jgi:ABC transporter DrrB family efflux protein
MKRGVIDRFRSMPMARSAVLAGRTLADLVRTIFVIGIMLAVGYAIGFRFGQGPLSAIASILVVAAFGFALSWIFAYVGLIAKGPEAAQSAGFVAIFPLVFASSIFVPVDTMPSWLQSIADVSPVTATADTARALAIGGDVWSSLWQVLVWVIGILIVFVPLCVRKYRRLQ